MLKRRVKSPNVAMRNPNSDSKRAYIKREAEITMTLRHPIPFHIFVIFPSAFFLRILVMTRMIDNVPRVTPDQKGMNPGPGNWMVPIPAWVDITQTKQEIATQKTPPN